jgi:hypothetical protein
LEAKWLEEYEQELYMEAEIEMNKIHKDGQRIDMQKFETQYKSQIDKWVNARKQREETACV